MKTLPVLGALAALAASPAFADAMAPEEYVMVAGASDLYETQSSQLVLETTADSKIRAFAQEMIRDHVKSTAEVKTAAEKSKVTAAPPTLMPPQAELIAQLRAETGPARDATYIAQQKASHNQALAVQTAYAAGGTAPTLKGVAGKIVPVVEHHITMLKAM